MCPRDARSSVMPTGIVTQMLTWSITKIVVQSVWLLGLTIFISPVHAIAAADHVFVRPAIAGSLEAPQPSLAGRVTGNAEAVAVRLWLRDLDSRLWMDANGNFGLDQSQFDIPLGPVELDGASWEWAPPILADGSYVLIVRVLGLDGQVMSGFHARSFKVLANPDLVGPHSTHIATPSGQGAIVSRQGFDLLGDTEDDVGIQHVDVWIRDTDSRLWLQPDGTFDSRANSFMATLEAPETAKTAWSLRVPPLPDGSFVAIVRAVDTSDNRALDFAARRIQVRDGADTMAPESSIIQPLHRARFETGDSVLVSGSASDNSAVSEVRIWVRNVELDQWLQADDTFMDKVAYHVQPVQDREAQTSVWEWIAPPLEAGHYQLITRAVDQYSTVERQFQLSSFYIDEQDPLPRNILYIMLDDADYYDFGYTNAMLDVSKVRTPTIDSLRDFGKAFSQFYSGSAICSPTRASVLTGNSPVSYGAFDAWPHATVISQGSLSTSGLAQSEVLLPRVMKEHGLLTGHHGKWHVGLSRPEYGHQAMGFDRFSYHEPTSQSVRGTWHGVYKFETESGAEYQDVGYIDSYFADRVIDTIREAADMGKGFYINYWPLTPHFPWSPPRDFDNTTLNFDLDTVRGNVLAMMHSIDVEIGRIVNTLHEVDQFDNTLIIVTSDNGGQRQAQSPFTQQRGSKGNLLEGGVRVPMVAHWPEGILPGTENSSVFTTADLLPTFVDLLGESPMPLYLDQGIYGRSKADSVRGSTEIAHDPMLWEISGGPTRTSDPRAKRSYAIRIGSMKLIKLEGRNDLSDPRAYKMYDLENDPQEKTNLSEIMPNVFNSMRIELNRMRREQSRVDILPRVISEPLSLSRDPRFDIGAKDMTFRFTIMHDEAIRPEDVVFYEHAGAQQLSLTSDGKILWIIQGVNETGMKTVLELATPQLGPGSNNVIVSIGGHKNDDSEFTIHVNGELAIEHQAVSTAEEPTQIVRSVNSVDTVPVFGSSSLVLNNVEFFLSRFYPDQFD